VNDQIPQTGPIAVYGASGYTGRLVARELARRGAEFVVAGRSRAKLEMVAEDAGGDPTVRDVALDDAAGLRELFEPCAAVIACAGPFQLHGEPVLAAALDAKSHYLDTTGEQPFMRLVFDRYGSKAETAGVVAVPAMGFDYAPGDMIAALAAEGMESLDELIVAYSVGGWEAIGPRATRGTALSALEILAGGLYEWTDGELRTASGGLGRGTFDFPPPIGRQRVLRYPAGENLTVPRHLDVARLRTVITAATMMPHPRLAIAAPLMMAPLQAAARTPLRRALRAAVRRLPEGPREDVRRRAKFTVVAEAVQGTRRRRGVVAGSDVYGTTARTIVEGALRCADPAYDRSGALAPSQAFDPREFLRALGSSGITYEIAPA
jgi:short subunit dehydrogenase-like uncharacterized protein